MSTIEGIIRQSTNNPLKMNDKIITVKSKGKTRLWEITSYHARDLNLLTRRKSLDRVDLLCLTDLGFKIKYEN